MKAQGNSVSMVAVVPAAPDVLEQRHRSERVSRVSHKHQKAVQHPGSWPHPRYLLLLPMHSGLASPTGVTMLYAPCCELHAV